MSHSIATISISESYDQQSQEGRKKKKQQKILIVGSSLGIAVQFLNVKKDLHWLFVLLFSFLFAFSQMSYTKMLLYTHKQTGVSVQIHTVA